MAPDANKLRQRKAVTADEVKAADAATVERVSTLKSIQPHEVAIDGVIYDISEFNHPGGESIKVFGGNDVTIQYKMIHPYHTSKHLEKMKRVGVVPDYACDYKFDTPFEKEMKQEVFKIVRRGKEFGTWGWHVRALFYTTAMFYLHYLWVFHGSSVWLAIAYGISQSLIGLNVQHDANHGASSKNHIINDIYGLGADFIGGSKWLWMEQHWQHHTYTNDIDKDPDALSAEPFMLFHNYPLGHPARKWWQRFQAFFYMLVLSGYWLSSVFNPEILDLKQSGAGNVGLQMESDYLKDRRKYAIAMRVYYIVTNAVVPFFYHHDNPLTAFGHVMLMGVAESLFLAVLFSLSHNFTVAERDPTKEAKESGEPVCWFKAQVETSCTYGGFVSGCVTGGLNFQIEHHLFPRMSSAWYPYIAPKVREICKKHGVHYEFYPYVWQNWFSTMRYMNAAGTGAWWKNGLGGNPLRGDL